MHRIISILLLLFVAIAVDCSARMTTVTFPSERCSIGLPTSWQRNTDAEQDLEGYDEAVKGRILLSARRVGTANTTLAVLIMVRVPHGEPVIVSEFVRGALGEMAAGAARDTSRRWTLGGIDALSIAGRLSNGLRSRIVAAFANDRGYLLYLCSSRGEPLADAEVDAIHSSFSFIGRPDVARLVTDADSATLKAVRFDRARCAISVPETWYRATDAEGERAGNTTVLAVGRTTESDTVRVMLTLRDIPGTGSIRDPGIMRGFQTQMKSSYTIERIGYSTLGGIDAIEAIGSRPGGAVTRTIFTLANDRMYIIVVNANSRALVERDDIRAIISSFSFIGTPKLPASGK